MDRAAGRPGGVSSQRGQLFRAPAGTWAIRFYDARGQRHQRNGFRTRGGGARGARGGAAPRAPRPAVPSARDGARAGRRVSGAVRGRAVDARRGFATTSTRPASSSGSERIGELSAQQVGAWRVSLPEKRRYPRASRAAPGARGRAAVEVDRGESGRAGEEPGAEAGRDRSVRELGGDRRDHPGVQSRRRRAGRVPGRHRGAAGGGVRRRVARRAARATAWSPSSARSPRAG